MHKRKSRRVFKKVISVYYKNNPFSTYSSAASIHSMFQIAGRPQFGLWTIVDT